MMSDALKFSPLRDLHYAKRPVLIAGAGADALLVRKLSNRLGVPVAPTWGALDGFPSEDPLTIGSFGTHGTRHGNFAVQNADWILSVGSRLDTKATGSPEKNFAPLAMKYVVDIDPAELSKFEQMGIDAQTLKIDSTEFLKEEYESVKATQGHEGSWPDFTNWRNLIQKWKERYPVPNTGPYLVIRRLSDNAKPGDIICCDTGCTVAWITQAWKFKGGQRLIHAWNQTPMGYGLPAAIGAHYATGKPVLLITGDGSLMMSINELATIKDLPIRVVLMNNRGHGMCRQTQRQWFNGEYPATSIEGGLKFPDFYKVGRAYGSYIEEYWIDPDSQVTPQVKFGRPNHEGDPQLPKEEYEAVEMEAKACGTFSN